MRSLALFLCQLLAMEEEVKDKKKIIDLCEPQSQGLIQKLGRFRFAVIQTLYLLL